MVGVANEMGRYLVKYWRCVEKSITMSRLFGQPNEIEYAFSKWLICLKSFDYAHHPDEIEAALQGVSQVSQGKTVVVFQPHLYSRTAVQYEAAGIALSRADMVLVLPIYPAREKPIPGITSQLVVDASVRAGGNCKLCMPIDVRKLLSEMEAEIIVFMGAGSIDPFARELVEDAE